MTEDTIDGGGVEGALTLGGDEAKDLKAPDELADEAAIDEPEAPEVNVGSAEDFIQNLASLVGIVPSAEGEPVSALDEAAKLIPTRTATAAMDMRQSPAFDDFKEQWLSGMIETTVIVQVVDLIAKGLAAGGVLLPR